MIPRQPGLKGAALLVAAATLLPAVAAAQTAGSFEDAGDTLVSAMMVSPLHPFAFHPVDILREVHRPRENRGTLFLVWPHASYYYLHNTHNAHS